MKIWICLAGAIFGVATQINMLASRPDQTLKGWEFVIRLAAGGIVGLIAALFIRRLSLRGFQKLCADHDARNRFARIDALSYIFLLVPVAGVSGIRVNEHLLAPSLALLVLFKIALAAYSLPPAVRSQVFTSRSWLSTLFFLSGFAALIYQIAWQRTLFGIYGVNIESVTVIVALFMAGLGVGALGGGWYSMKESRSLPVAFFGIEILIGAFGVISLCLIKQVGSFTVTWPLSAATLAIFAVLSVPTMLMGATLPILVTYLTRQRVATGRAVGILYFINTLGSATACFVTAHFLLAYFGLQTAVWIAAGFNGVTGVLVYRYMHDIAKTDTTIGHPKPAGEVHVLYS